MMLGKRRRPTAVTIPKKRKKNTSAIEEISFDFSAREDYLTGFHKRKLQRVKRAQEEAAQQEKVDKIAARKALRESRKADLENHVDQINALLCKAEDGEGSSETEDDVVTTDRKAWGGIEAPGVVDEEAEFVDEDRRTTVTIEAVDVTRDGLRKVEDESKKGNEEDVTAVSGADAAKDSCATVDENGKRIWTKERPGGPKKKKKLKFRYESKADRKMTRYKERSGNKSKAKDRSEKTETRTGGGKAQAMARKKKGSK